MPPLSPSFRQHSNKTPWDEGQSHSLPITGLIADGGEETSCFLSCLHQTRTNILTKWRNIRRRSWDHCCTFNPEVITTSTPTICELLLSTNGGAVMFIRVERGAFEKKERETGVESLSCLRCEEGYIKLSFSPIMEFSISMES